MGGKGGGELTAQFSCAPAKIWRVSVRSITAVVLIIALTGAAFLGVAGNGFVNFDDPNYILENPIVREGLQPAAVARAFTTFHASNWHPLTWLSHMLDVELFGVRPGPHHLMSLLYHTAAAVTLYFFLRGCTGAPWLSLFTVLCFAVHPLRVESVAWASERKDVLSALLWMLTLAAYLRYVRKPGAARYLTLAVAFSLGLMAKPMLVSLPAVLLLLDFWPFARFRALSPGRLVIEKFPLFALALGAGLLTLRAQASAVLPEAAIPFSQRFANAALSTGTYVTKTIWPSALAVFYPRPAAGPGLGRAIVAVVAIALATALAIRFARRKPFLLAGLGWYFVTLLPVLGLIQVGEQMMADRYTYLPSVGLGIAAVWLLNDLTHGNRFRVAALVLAGGLVLIAWGATTVRTVRIWHDSLTLFGHALRVTRDNWAAHCYLGGELARQGRVLESIPEFEQSTRIRSNFPQAWYNLALARDLTGDTIGAGAAYLETLRLDPGNAEAHNNLGVIMAGAGDTAAATGHFREALRTKPDFPAARENLERALAVAGE